MTQLLKYGDIPDEKFDPVQLKRGTEVEMKEHGDPKLAKQIAKGHLWKEGMDYYIYLDDMEKRMKFKDKVEASYQVVAGDVVKFTGKTGTNTYAIAPQYYKRRGFGPTSQETEMWLADISKLKGDEQAKSIQNLLNSIQPNEGANENYVNNTLSSMGLTPKAMASFLSRVEAGDVLKFKPRTGEPRVIKPTYTKDVPRPVTKIGPKSRPDLSPKSDKWEHADGNMTHRYLMFVADALEKNGWLVSEPKMGSNVLDVWEKSKKKGFVEITITGLVHKIQNGMLVIMGTFSWTSGISEEGDEHDVEVEVDIENNKPTVGINELHDHIKESFNFTARKSK